MPYKNKMGKADVIDILRGLSSNKELGERGGGGENDTWDKEGLESVWPNAKKLIFNTKEVIFRTLRGVGTKGGNLRTGRIWKQKACFFRRIVPAK